MTIFGAKQPFGPGSLGGGVPDAVATPGGVIDHDLPCTQCGYNLRGLTSGMNCPECAAPVARSAHGRWLRFANAEWLDRLHHGVLLKLWSMLVTLVVSFGAAALVFMGFPQGLVSSVGLIGGALATYGVFLLTSPEPNIAILEDPVNLRRVFRWVALIGLGISVLNLAGQLSGWHLVLMVFGGAGSIVGVVMLFCEFVYLRRFARRVPDEVLARRTSTVMWGYVIVMAVGAVMGAVMVAMILTGALPGMGAGFGPPGAALGPPGAGGAAGAPVAAPAAAPPMGFVVPFMAAGCVVGVGMLVFGVLYLSLLFKYLRSFREARDFSLAMGRSAPQTT